METFARSDSYLQQKGIKTSFLSNDIELNLFHDKKIPTLVRVEGPEARYDLSEAGHAHYYCSGSGGIFDISIEEVIMPESQRKSSVQEVQLHFKGLCPGCR